MEKKSSYLVVDDSPTVRKHVSYLLRLVAREDADVQEAQTKSQAIAAFKAQEPGVVFLDVMMPNEKDGMDTMSAMFKVRPEAKVVLLTALAQDHPTVEKAISQGATAYIRKPV